MSLLYCLNYASVNQHLVPQAPNGISMIYQRRLLGFAEAHSHKECPAYRARQVLGLYKRGNNDADRGSLPSNYLVSTSRCVLDKLGAAIPHALDVFVGSTERNIRTRRPESRCSAVEELGV